MYERLQHRDTKTNMIYLFINKLHKDITIIAVLIISE